MQNPNGYDDDSYINACNAVQARLPAMLDALFLAGGDLSNIQDELTNAFENCMTELAGAGLKVTIYEPD